MTNKAFWTLGEPIYSDESNFFWSLGEPYIRYEVAVVTVKEITDNLSLSDSVLAHKTFAITDSIGLADAEPLTDRTLPLVDEVSLAEQILRDRSFSITDSISLGDTALAHKTLIFTDLGALTGQILADKLLDVIDSIVLSGEISKTVLEERRCHVEIYESPGFIDDGFRASWVKQDGIGTFENCGTIAGDYARETVTDPSSPLRYYRIGLNLSTDTYRVLRIRVRGGGADPQYQVSLYEEGYGAFGATGWQTPSNNFEGKMFEIPADRTVNRIYLWVRSASLQNQVYIDWDYVAILPHPPLIPEEIEGSEVDLQTTSAVSGFKMSLLNDPLFGVTVLRLPFNENFGTRAYDLSRYKNHGTIHDATWVDGIYGKALSFNGTSAYIQIADSPSLDISDDFSLELWIKIIAFPSGWAPLILKSDSEYVKYWNYGLILYSDGDLSFGIGDGSTHNLLTDQVYLQTGRWYHITAILEGSYLRLYVNGVEEGSTPRTIDPAPNAVDLFFARQGDRYLNCIIDEARIYNRALAPEEIYQLYVTFPLSGAVRAGVGDICMVYLAASAEKLEEGLIKGRIIDVYSRGEPDNPVIEYVGEDWTELLHERSYTKEFANATQISEIVKGIIDDQFPEFTRVSVETTNRAVKNKFEDEPPFNLLRKLAETASFSTGEKGANFYIDCGGDLHFQRLGRFNGPALSDGSDGNSANIMDISVHETLKGNPKLVNDVKLIIFEAEHIPRDEDSWTETVEDPYNWTSPDPTDEGSPSEDTGDVKSGNTCIKFNTTNPGSQYRMRVTIPSTNIAQMEKLKFWLKYGSGLNPENLEIRLCCQSGWLWNNYWVKSGLSVPSPETWYEYEVDLDEFTVGAGFPTKDIIQLQFRLYRSSGDLGAGGIKIDKLRFERPVIYRTASDSTSQSRYGVRKATLVDKTITDMDFAQYVAESYLEHYKDPVKHLQVTTPGRAQPGYRSPQHVSVTSLKDGLRDEIFQITRARHRYTTEEYTCKLELIAAQKPDGRYEPKVSPRPPAEDMGAQLAGLRRRYELSSRGLLRGEWNP